MLAIGDKVIEGIQHGKLHHVVAIVANRIAKQTTTEKDGPHEYLCTLAVRVKTPKDTRWARLPAAEAHWVKRKDLSQDRMLAMAIEADRKAARISMSKKSYRHDTRRTNSTSTSGRRPKTTRYQLQKSHP
jgi:hypothetical protein